MVRQHETMIEIVPLSPENELPAAERLRGLILAEWPDLAGTPANDRVRIFVGVGLLFDVDIVVEISLARDRPVGECRMRGGDLAPAASIGSGLLAIEVKQHSRECFEIAGPEIFPAYGRAPSTRSVGKQVADSVVATKQFLKRYSNEPVFVHGLGWLTDMPERELADLLRELGEERAARRIARAVAAARAEAPITTTGQLARIIRDVLPPDRSGLDPATRSFQALRIRVNDELGEITRGLVAATRLLAPGGRLIVVAFHSLEDRIVKRFMIEAAGRTPAPSRHDPGGLVSRPAPGFRLLTPRAVRPEEAETRANPRARSARLRALERLPRHPPRAVTTAP